jgi:sec-independent protein translocase protein TatB
MFDIGFGQLIAIALVALLVIGRMQRYVNDVKADISREMELDELRKLQASVEEAAQSINQSVSQQLNETESQLNKLAQFEAPEPSAPKEDAPAGASADSPPASQLELGLDSSPQSQQKQG